MSRKPSPGIQEACPGPTDRIDNQFWNSGATSSKTAQLGNDPASGHNTNTLIVSYILHSEDCPSELLEHQGDNVGTS